MKKDLNDDLIVFIKIGAFFIVLAFVFYFINFGFQGLSNDQEVWAQFGDYFGGVLNPVFAFLAFIALLITINLQNKALTQSKEELELTRKELEKSTKAQEEQSRSLKLQNQATMQQVFENTFFQLNELFNNIKKGLSIKVDIFKDENGFIDGSGGTVTDYFGIDDNDFNTLDCINTSKFISYEVIEKYLLILKKNYWLDYEEFNKRYEKYTGTYFGQAYQIIKFIDDSNIEDKQRYINIFRAQFTKYELEFLFYHCLGKIGKRRFKALIEEYEFFEHITNIEKREGTKSISEYNISTYGKNEDLRKMHNDYKIEGKDKYWNQGFDEKSLSL